MLLKPELTRSKTTQRHPQCNAHTRAVVSRTYSGLLKRTLASQVKSILRGFQRTWAKRTELGTPRVLVGHSRISSHSQHHPAGFYCPSGRKTEPPLNGGDGGPFTAGGGGSEPEKPSLVACRRAKRGRLSIPGGAHALLSPWPVTSIAAPIPAEVGKRRSPSRPALEPLPSSSPFVRAPSSDVSETAASAAKADSTRAGNIQVAARW